MTNGIGHISKHEALRRRKKKEVVMKLMNTDMKFVKVG
jgi:hypothetical protein